MKAKNVKIVKMNGEKVLSESLVNLQEDILQTGLGTVGSVLIPAKIYDSLQNAVRKNLIFRQLAGLIVGPSGIPGPTLNINLQDPESMSVFEVAEGAEISTDKETYTNRSCTPKKYGIRVGITKEMVEDSQFDLMQYNAATAGYELADNEDSLAVTQLTAADTAAGHTVTGGAAITIANITAAMQFLETDNYKPTDLIVGVEVANDLRNIDTFVEADKAGVANPTMSLIGTIYGMKVWVSNNVTAKHAYVIDRAKALALVEKRPVTLANYDKIETDTSYVVATQRVGWAYLYAHSVSKITTT